MNEFDVLIGLCMGLGLAAASGFRVFLPPFLLSIAVRGDAVEVDLANTSLEYFDSNVAVIVLGVATLAELSAYYVPWVDNLLDTIASPAAVVAGTGMTAIVLEGNTDPVIQWSLSIIAGGGVSAAVQSATVVTRGISTTLTAGIANPVVSTEVTSWNIYRFYPSSDQGECSKASLTRKMDITSDLFPSQISLLFRPRRVHRSFNCQPSLLLTLNQLLF